MFAARTEHVGRVAMNPIHQSTIPLAFMLSDFVSFLDLTWTEALSFARNACGTSVFSQDGCGTKVY